MSKEIPMLFNTPMVQAILAGRKTQTRRPVKPKPDGAWDMQVPRADMSIYKDKYVWWDGNFCSDLCSPFGAPGDILWVRERLYFDMDAGWKYWADESLVEGDYSAKKQYCPSIHMPYDACRLKLRVKRVWVERVQDISEEDSKAEGVIYERDQSTYGLEWDGMFRVYDCMNCGHCYKTAGEASRCCEYRMAFEDVWQSIYKNWNENPWAWACEFEVIT